MIMLIFLSLHTFKSNFSFTDNIVAGYHLFLSKQSTTSYFFKLLLQSQSFAFEFFSKILKSSTGIAFSSSSKYEITYSPSLISFIFPLAQNFFSNFCLPIFFSTRKSTSSPTLKLFWSNFFLNSEQNCSLKYELLYFFSSSSSLNL